MAEQISGDELPLLADTQNRYQNRDFLASWEGDPTRVAHLRGQVGGRSVLANDATEDEDGEAEDGSEPED